MKKDRFFKEVFQPSDQWLERQRTRKGIFGIFGIYGVTDQVIILTNELKF